MNNNETEILNPIRGTTEISWETFEYEHKPVSNDWYWAVGLIAIIASATSFYYNNVVFGAFSLMAGITMIMFKIKGPSHVRVRLTPRGVIIKNTIYPYGRIESFWIYEADGEITQINELSIKSDRAFLPQIIIPLGDVDVELVKDYLSRYIQEEYHEKAMSDIISEYIGF
ncbi:MAG: hypothetical protein UT05_C0003G0044 [Parcubacteria group bacterium GW2011_GWF2_38_76]|nr:MAG: hypothetical protein UT05_C0003G0044 [Parcubacteria group bacterium GW2011_GWF2_38_76]HBM46184.1 hypothetical protein [Patescibacteria group bacterium]